MTYAVCDCNCGFCSVVCRRCLLLQLVGSYPVVAKSLRDIRKSGGKPVHRQHCCGMTLQEHGLGYDDLDKLLQNPQPLEFIIGMFLMLLVLILFSWPLFKLIFNCKRIGFVGPLVTQ